MSSTAGAREFISRQQKTLFLRTSSPDIVCTTLDITIPVWLPLWLKNWSATALPCCKAMFRNWQASWPLGFASLQALRSPKFSLQAQEVKVKKRPLSLRAPPQVEMDSSRQKGPFMDSPVALFL